MPGRQPSHSRDPSGFLSSNMATRHNPGPGMMPRVVDASTRVPEVSDRSAAGSHGAGARRQRADPIVTTIIKNKRRNVAARLAAKKAQRHTRRAKAAKREYEFQIPNS